MNNMYAQQFPMQSSNYCATEQMINSIAQRSTPRVKVDLNLTEPSVQKNMRKKKLANKAGPKETWVPKST